MAAIRTKGGEVLNKYILTKIFAFDDSASDARTPCIARGWDAVRRGPPLIIWRSALSLEGRRVIGPDNACWTVSANGIAISPDNTTLAVGGNLTPSHGFDVALYDTRTGERRLQLASRSIVRYVCCVSFSPDGETIAVGTSMGLSLYSATTGEPQRAITSRETWFTQIGSNGMLLATSYYEKCTLFEPSTIASGTIYLKGWSNRSNRYGHDTPYVPRTAARFSPDATMLAVARSGRRLRLVDTTTGASRKIETRSSTVAFSPDGKTLASGHCNFVGLYDCGTLALRTQCLLNPSYQVSAVAFSAAGTLMFTVCPVPSEGIFTVCPVPPRLLNMSGPSFLYRHDTNNPTVRHHRRELDLYGLGSGIRKTEFSSDGSLLAVVGNNQNVALYDVATATRRLAPRPRREK